MNKNLKRKLMGALLGCPTISDRASRDTVVDELPDEIKHSIKRDNRPSFDLGNIVKACLNYRDGIEELIEIVRFYEGPSIPIQKVDEVWSQIKLFDIASKVNLADETLAKLYRATLPDGVSVRPQANTLWSVLEHLWDIPPQSDGTRPILAFAERLACHTDQPSVANELRSWTEQIAPSFGLTPADIKRIRAQIDSETRQINNKTKTWADLSVQSANPHHAAPRDKLNAHLLRVKDDFVDHMRNREDLTTEQADRRYVELLVRERIKEHIRNTRPREGPFSQFIEPSSPRLLLLGESGSGKTTLLLKLAVDAAASALQDLQKLIPIYVRLNFFDTKEGGFARLLEMVGNAAGLDKKDMEGVWRNAERGCLFLLDGFNQVAPHFQQECILALQEFMRNKQHRYIITSRPTVLGQKLEQQTLGVNVLDIVPLREDQMQEFLKRYGAAGLYERMDAQLKGLARNPFMLRALIQSDTVSVGGELPRNRGQLYQNFIDRSMFAEREEQKTPPPTKYNYPLVKKPILAKLALMMSRERVTRRQEERRLLKLLWEWLKEFRAENKGLVEIKPYELMPDPPAAKALLDEAVHNGVLRRVENSLEFMHQSVQDYFAAVQLNILGFENPEVRGCLDEIAQDKMDDTWDETMILLAGLTSDLDRLVTELLPRDRFLACRCAGVRPKALQPLKAAHLIETLASTSVETLARVSQDLYSPWWQKVITAYEQALPFAQKDSGKWANLQHNLGLAYANLPTGDRAANLMQAIECFKIALRFFTTDSASDEYAAIQNHLGNAFRDLPTGNRRENLERAIKSYEEALRVHTPDATPLEHAATLSNLGNAYRDLQTGNWKANQVQAIRWYEEALHFLTPKTVPFEYAATQTNLGNAYRDLPTGDREANLMQAIACYQEALRFYKRESAPYEYAATLTNLANAYCKWPMGNRGVNLAQAITYYQEALRFYTQENAPYNYAVIQNNLGNAYRDLPRGNHGANLEKAIECYQEALRVWTLETTPYDYATALNNLGNAYRDYRDLPKDERWANLTRAIECFKLALQVRRLEAVPYDYAATLSNLGDAYHNRHLLANDWEQVERTIKCFKLALEVRTREAAPYDYAATMNSLGNAYRDLPTGNREANLIQAIECYQEALRFLTPEMAPYECRQTNRYLADLYFQERDWRAALDAYHAAMDVGEQLYRTGLSAESKATEIAENIALYRNAAFATARLGDTTQALLTLERGKTRLLAEVWRLRVPCPQNVPDEVWSTFEQAGATIHAIQYQGASVPSNEPDFVQAYLASQQTAHEANAALNAAIWQVRKYAPDFFKEIDLPTIQALIPDEQTALVAFCITGMGSHAFIVSQKQPEAVQIVEMPNFSEGDLNRLLFAKSDEDEDVTSGWIGDYRKQNDPQWHSTWLSTMERVLTEVGEKLLAPVIAALAPDIDKLIFLPCDGLFLLPLHAVPLSKREERVCDRYQVSYAPSLEMLINSQLKAARSSGHGLYAVIDPEKRFAFTPTEGAAISELFAEPQIHEGEAATKEAVIAGVRGQAYVHFSCAGGYNWDDPSASNLILADARLTLADLQSGLLDMSACRIVTLSSGETGLTDVIKGSAEEYVSLSAGFMLAGVPCVVASLWAVPDISTTLLMERFYRNHLERGMDFVAALHEAQAWVRHLHVGEVAEYAEKCYREFKWGNKAELFKNMRHYRYRAEQNPNERPFAHPYYWAAFTVNGM